VKGSRAVVMLAALVVACGATRPPLMPEVPACGGTGEAAAVSAAVVAFDASHPQDLGEESVLFNEVLSCWVATPSGIRILTTDSQASRLFALSCWVRGGPIDGQCRPGRGRGRAPELPTPPSDGSQDFALEWLLEMRALPDSHIVVVTIGSVEQGYELVVVHREGEWQVLTVILAWTT